MSINSALIFAAGFGTRMGTLTQSVPKPMIQVANQPLIDYALDLVLDAKVENIVVNVHHLPKQIEAHLASNSHIKILHETPTIFETGGGLKNALSLLGPGPVITINSDAVWTGNNPISSLLKYWNPNKMDALLMLIPTSIAQEYKGKGDFNLDSELRLSRRGANKNAPYVYSGAQIIKTNLLEEILETSFSLNLLWDKMLKNKRMSGIIHNGGWVDVGRPEGIKVAVAELARVRNV